MIVSVCADKDRPGVTTLAVALGVVWPGLRVVLEADTSGGVLPFRMRTPDGDLLAAEPSIASLGAVARVGLPDGLESFAQATSVGVPVVPGALSPERYEPLRSWWPRIAAEAASWPGTVIADLGRLGPGGASGAVARQSRVVVLMARPDLEGLHHLRDRVVELARAVGDTGRGVSPVAVVVAAPAREHRRAISDAEQLLAAIGSPVPVAGYFAVDPVGARDLWAGQMTRRLAGSELIRSAQQIAQWLIARDQGLAAPPTADAAVVEKPIAPGDSVGAERSNVGMEGVAR